MSDEPPESHRPPHWPDHDQDFKTHDDAASYWLMVMAVPLMVIAVAAAFYWLL